MLVSPCSPSVEKMVGCIAQDLCTSHSRKRQAALSGSSFCGQHLTCSHASWRTFAVKQVCIVTGANAGIGLETSKMLVARGAHLIIACRSQQKGMAAARVWSAYAFSQQICQAFGHHHHGLLCPILGACIFRVSKPTFRHLQLHRAALTASACS